MPKNVKLLLYMNLINKLIVNTRFGTCNNISLNSGTYIGFSKDLLQIIKQIRSFNDDNDADDQILMTNFCKINESKFYIDINNELFLALNHPLNEIEDIVNISKDLKTSYNENFPFFLHGPGSTSLDNVIQKLGYCNHELDINEQIKYKYNLIHVFLNGYPTLFFTFFLIIVIISIYLLFRKKK